MRKILLFVSAILMICSCIEAQKKSEKQKTESELEVALSNAENATVTEIKCFLDFKFGMTEKEVDDHLSKLYKEKKIYANRSNSYQYDFSFRGMTIYMNFIPEYFDDKLYKMTYPCSTSLGGDVHVFLMAAFRETKPGFQTLINEDILGETYYTNYKDNMIVTFKDSRMIYENAPVSKLAKQQEEKEKTDKYNRSKSEF